MDDALISVLMVEDDQRLADLTRQYLERHGLAVTLATDGERGLELARRQRFDAVLLDLMLPGLDGMDVCRRLREHSDVPVLMITARGEEADRVMGLELGADDYLPKPFSARELLARVRAAVRRARGQVGPRRQGLAVGPLELDPAARRASLKGRLLDLTSYEFDLLFALAELEQLMDDVLTTARLDLADGGLGHAIRLEPLDPLHLAREARRRYSERHPGRPLEMDLPASAPTISGDSALLHRVLGNLLDNAARHSGDEGPVELALGQDGDHVWVEVRDRGVGVDPADLPRLFDRFFRGDRSRTRDTGGTGLGLSICKRVVVAHGGQIAAASRHGGGLVLRFTLPTQALVQE